MKEEKVSNHFLSGAISSSFSAIITQPFDVIKTNMIGNQPVKITSALSILTNITKEQGIKGLWKGSVPTFWRVFPGGGIYYSLLHMMEKQMKNFKKDLGKMDKFVIGAASRGLATTIMSPITLVKTRFEYYPKHLGFASTLVNIAKTDGVKGLFSGLLPSILRDAPFSGLFYLFYTSSKTIFSNYLELPEDSHYVQAPSGSIAGVLATLFTHPFDVARTRIQLSIFEKKYTGLFQTFKSLHSEGPSVYFRGLIPRCIKRSIQSTLSWTFYEQLAILFKNKL